MKPLDSGVEDSDDEISVGCPSPQPEQDNSSSINGNVVMTSQRGDDESGKNSSAGSGVRSFSILDILNHRPTATAATQQPKSVLADECNPTAPKIRRKSHPNSSVDEIKPTTPTDSDSPTKIIRPWDYPHLALPAHFQASFLHPNRCLPFHLPAPHPFALHHPHHHAAFQHHPAFAAAAAAAAAHHHFSRGANGLLTGNGGGRLSPSSSASAASPDYISSDCEGADDGASTDGASSSGSPQLTGPKNNKKLTGNHHKSGGASTSANNSGNNNNTPLDALFQMTSKTFEGASSNGADSSGSQSGGGNGGGGGGNASGAALFSPRQQAKKKRKSRTAFTNHQIFELEKRFLYQKYLSPADRDEIALTLGLTNAQVITWFQNRRAKLKRDMEELKKDVESAKILGSHHAAHHAAAAAAHHHHHHHAKAFIGAMDLNLLQKKADEYNQAMAQATVSD